MLRRVELTNRFSAMLWANISGKRQQLLIPCAAADQTLVWSEAIMVADRARFRAYTSSFTSAATTLVTQVQDGNLDFRLGDDLGLASDVSAIGLPIALIAAQDGRATLLVTTNDVYRTDTDHALRLLALEPEVLGPLQGLANPAVEINTPEADPPQVAAQLTSAPSQPSPSSQPVAATRPAPEQPETVTLPIPATDPPIVLSSAEIKAVQEALARLGYRVGKADGILGKRSAAAIDEWQDKMGLARTGVLTLGQYDALLQEAGQ